MSKITISCPESMGQHVQSVLSGEYNVDLPADCEIRSILDIGANVGAFTIWAKAKFPEANVLAFEPEPENAGIFRKNTAGLAGVNLCEQAIGQFPGRAQLFQGVHNCGEHSLVDCGEQDMTSAVEVECIASHTLPSADWVKLDCEGAEVWALEGLDLSETKVVTLEFHGRDRRDACKAILRKDFHLIDEQTNGKGTRGIQKWIRKGIPRKPLVFMALPKYGGGEPLFEECMYRALLDKQPRVPILQRSLIGDSLVSRSRNNLVAEFMNSAASHLLFVDTDLVFSRDQIDRMISHDLPVVGGLYPKKQRDLAWVCNADPEHSEPDANGLMRVLYVGTGFMLIRRDVIERMMEAYPESWYCADAGEAGGDRFDAFPVGVYHYSEEQQARYKQPRARYLSEDWWFCQRCIDLGIPVYADTRVILKHVGKYVYHDNATFLATQKVAENETAAA